ncbi:MAG: hypothetical protein MHPSP_003187, partial [Paramarteilia canceri]
VWFQNRRARKTKYEKVYINMMEKSIEEYMESIQNPILFEQTSLYLCSSHKGGENKDFFDV